MLRTLGITTALRWFAVAIVVVAIWRGFNGDLGLIASTVWSWIIRGADLLTSIWHQVMA